MLLKALRFAYRAVNKVMPLDYTYVYQLDLEQERDNENSSGNGFDLRFLSADEILHFSADAANDLGDDTQKLLDRMGRVECLACLNHDGQLAGYAWFASEKVLPDENCAGPAFRGLGMQLGEEAVYQFKVFVRPEFRGKRIAGQLFNEAKKSFAARGIRYMVTTTDWSNKSFQRAADRFGFQSVSRTIECKLFGKHFYRIAKPQQRLGFQLTP